MTGKTKDRAGWHQATPKISKCASYFTVLASRMKAVIVTLALWGWLPVVIADWLINRRELRDE
jgi:hypothetical protein